MLTVGIIENGNEIKDSLLTKYGEKFHFTQDIKNTVCDIIIYDCGTIPDKAKCKVCLLNSDEKANISFKSETTIISYGLNSLATATASSITEDENGLCFQYCLQRSFFSLSGKKTEPQEFPVCMTYGTKIHSALAIESFILFCDL